MSIVRIQDFEVNGSINWEDYRRAQIQNGERCSECGAFITTFEKGHPTSCVACQDLLVNPGEATHQSKIRCPSCRATLNARNHYGDVVHRAMLCDEAIEAHCPSCNHRFTIRARMELYYTSPALVVTKTEGEDRA